MSSQVSMIDSEFDLFVPHWHSYVFIRSVARSTSGRRGCFRSRDYEEMNIQSRSEGRISFSNGKRLGVSRGNTMEDQLPARCLLHDD